MAGSGEGLISPLPLQVTVPPTHSSCYATLIIMEKCTFFKYPFWGCVRTYAVWGICPAPFISS